MLRGNCQARLYCRFCDSVAWSTFEVGFLDHPAECCHVGDDLSEELVGLWRNYAVVRHPETATNVQIIEKTSCPSCASDLWVRLVFVGGVLSSASSAALTRSLLAEVNYVSTRISETFERVTMRSFFVGGRPRSDWPALLSGRRECDEEWAHSRELRVRRWKDSFVIDGDYSSAWTQLLRECSRSGELEKLGSSTDALDVDGGLVGPVSAMDVPTEVAALRHRTVADDWVLRRGTDEWAFLSKEQLRAAAASVMVLSGAPLPVSEKDTNLYREIDGLRIVERISPRRYRAIAHDGRVALVDIEHPDEEPKIVDEPPGEPLGTTTVPLQTSQCAAIGAQLATWALERRDPPGGPFALVDVYATFEPQSATVTGVVPGGGLDYAPPELLQSGRLVEEGVVFTICAIVAHLATGAHPFVDGATGIVDERRRAFWGDPAIATLVDRGLDPVLERRGTLKELREAFERVLEETRCR